MAESFEQQLRKHNRVVMDIVQQGLDVGSIRLVGPVSKKAVYDLLSQILVDGAGVTLTYSATGVTITITAP